MAVVMRMHWTGVTPEQYDEARRQVGWEEVAAEGGLLHIAGFDEDGLNVVDVWETPEHFQRFVEKRLKPVTDEIGVGTGEPEVSFHSLHAVWSPKAELALT